MSIRFTCPHCQATTEVADQYAGQSGPCGKCGQHITIPHLADMASPQPRGSGSTVTTVVVICVLAALGVACLIGVPFALLYPAVGAARHAAQRSQTGNNLKQIGLALHSYHDVWKVLPPAVTKGPDGQPWHSWRVLILPYLEQSHIYDQYRMDEPWDSPHNQQFAQQMPQSYMRPGDVADVGGTTHFVAITGPETAFPPEGEVSLSLLTQKDGASNTIFVVESTDAVSWMAPHDLDLGSMSLTLNDPAGNAIGGNSPQGASVLYGDGSMRFLRNDSATPDVVRALCTKEGGEVLPPVY